MHPKFDCAIIVQLLCNFATGSYVKDQMHGVYFAKRCTKKVEFLEFMSSRVFGVREI